MTCSRETKIKATDHREHKFGSGASEGRPLGTSTTPVGEVGGSLPRADVAGILLDEEATTTMSNKNGTSPLVEFPAVGTPEKALTIIEICVDASVVATCQCGGRQTFLVQMRRPGTCSACGTAFHVKQITVLPNENGSHQISVQIGQKAPAIARPHLSGLIKV